MIPRSLSAKLFLAIAVVSATALILGAWLVQRVLHYEVKEDLTVTRDAGGGPDRIVRHVVTTGTDPRQSVPVVETLDRRLLIALGLVLGGTAIATMVIARRVVKPVATLRSAAEQMARGDLRARVVVSGQDEIAALGHAFNTMADKLDADERLRRDLTNDVAHELRTPLTHLRCHLEALQDQLAAATPETIATLLAEVLHLQHLVEDLADLARAEAGQLTLAVHDVGLEPVVSMLARELAPRIAAAGLALDVEVPARLPELRADDARLTQVLRNLVDNAIAHTAPGGRVRVTARAAAPGVEIEVADTGVGIQAEHLPRLFERFYRTDPSRSRETGGAGLGLAIVRQLVRAHGGAVRAESEPGHGSRFIIDWPAAL
jgi:two-component system sensor histidine kinase BaeS